MYFSLSFLFFATYFFLFIFVFCFSSPVQEARAKRRSESQAQLSAMYASRSKVGGTTASSKPLTEAERKKLMDKAKEKLPKPPQNEKKKK